MQEWLGEGLVVFFDTIPGGGVESVLPGRMLNLGGTVLLDEAREAAVLAQDPASGQLLAAAGPRASEFLSEVPAVVDRVFGEYWEYVAQVDAAVFRDLSTDAGRELALRKAEFNSSSPSRRAWQELVDLFGLQRVLTPAVTKEPPPPGRRPHRG